MSCISVCVCLRICIFVSPMRTILKVMCVYPFPLPQPPRCLFLYLYSSLYLYFCISHENNIKGDVCLSFSAPPTTQMSVAHISELTLRRNIWAYLLIFPIFAWYQWYLLISLHLLELDIDDWFQYCNDVMQLSADFVILPLFMLKILSWYLLQYWAWYWCYFLKYSSCWQEKICWTYIDVNMIKEIIWNVVWFYAKIRQW